MILDLGAVAREAAARWRLDRAILLPLAGLTLFVPQWAVLLLVPEPPQLAGAVDPAAATAWAMAMQRWVASYGLLYLAAFLAAQLGQLTVVALYVHEGERPTLAGALRHAGRLLPRYLLAGLLVAMPLVGAGLAGLGLPALLGALLPLAFYVLGRTTLAGAAIVGRRGTRALAAIQLSWRWTSGRGLALTLLVGGLLIGMSAVSNAASVLIAVLARRGVANPLLTAALDGVAAATAAAGMLALAMMQAVLYRRLAR